MKVLLTGASGFLGRHVLQALQARGVNVVTIGRQVPSPGIPHLSADLLGADDWAHAVAGQQASHLLHLAWYAEHGQYWSSMLNLQWVHATLQLVQAFAQGGGSHVVAAGTCAEYDWAHGWCREDTTPLAPATLYGTAKDATRRLLGAACAPLNLSWAWGRVFLPYGQGEAPARLIPSLHSVFTGQRAPFGVNAEAWRDFLHVSDVASAFVTLLDDRACGAYNISSAEPVRLSDVVRRLAQACNANPEPVLRLATERPGEPRLLAGDNSRLCALGWQPAMSLDRGLALAALEPAA